jgi:hypothetical protein
MIPASIGFPALVLGAALAFWLLAWEPRGRRI